MTRPQALLVDDSRAIRKIVGRMMIDLGFDVCEADNGISALDVLAGPVSVDLALVDWNMPEMNGVEFLRKVRASERWADLPLVMVTSETGLDHISEALAAGASEYIMKPFDRMVVEEKLQLLGFETSSQSSPDRQAR